MKQLMTCVFVFGLFFIFGQSDQVDRYLKAQQDKNGYVGNKKFEGPNSLNSVYPSEIVDKNTIDEGDYTNYGPLDIYVEPEQINGSRFEKYGEEYGEGAVKKPNPEIVPPNPIELPEIKLPDVKLPDVDLPDVDLPSFGTWESWRIFFVIVIILILLFGVYLLIRNFQPYDSKVKLDLDDEWNPTLVTKSELELKLEKAELGNNYRECVRIHFMFILKALIDKEIIAWKPEKTNNDYLNEVRRVKGYDAFQECVRIYDLVWYGDYEITLQTYNQLKPTLENYYSSLTPSV